VPERKLT